MWEENDKRDKNTEVQIESGSNWTEDEQFLCCTACLRHANDDNVPAKFKTFRRGNFGIIKKSGGSNFSRNFSIKRHSDCNFNNGV